jgi:hypothetical protein
MALEFQILENYPAFLRYFLQSLPVIALSNTAVLSRRNHAPAGTSDYCRAQVSDKWNAFRHEAVRKHFFFSFWLDGYN